MSYDEAFPGVTQPGSTAMGEKIKRLRRDKKVSQEALAAAIGVSNNTVSRWENNAIQPTAKNLVAIAQFFGISTEYFLSDTDEEREAEKASEGEAVSESVSVAEADGDSAGQPEKSKKSVPKFYLIEFIAGCAMFITGGAFMLYVIFGFEDLPQALKGTKVSFINNVISIEMPLPVLIILLILLALIIAGLILGVFSAIKIYKITSANKE